LAEWVDSRNRIRGLEREVESLRVENEKQVSTRAINSTKTDDGEERTN
jgi:hypothetical protein